MQSCNEFIISRINWMRCLFLLAFQLRFLRCDFIRGYRVVNSAGRMYSANTIECVNHLVVVAVTRLC